MGSSSEAELLYTGMEYAKFRDMVISLDDGDAATLINLKAMFTLLYTKEFKHRMNEDRVLHFSTVRLPKYQHMAGGALSFRVTLLTGLLRSFGDQQ